MGGQSNQCRAAFENHPCSHGTEEFIVRALRDVNALTISLLKLMGAKGCVLVGDPGYYQRFGFKSIPGLTVEGTPWENVLAIPFEKDRCRVL